MSTRTLASHYTRLLSLWPSDPNRTLTFTSVLQKRLSRYQSPQSSQSPTSTPSSASSTSKGATAAGGVPDEKAELVNINALYSLVEDRYAKRHPLSPTYLQPPSNPAYYHDLVRELEEAPKRSWIQRLGVRLKGMVRFQ